MARCGARIVVGDEVPPARAAAAADEAERRDAVLRFVREQVGEVVAAERDGLRADVVNLKKAGRDRGIREPFLLRIVVNADGSYGGVGYNPLSQAPPVDTPSN